MTRRTLTAALIAGALLTPQSSEGQALTQPLRTMCLSHAMDYCLSIFTWDWFYPSGSNPDGRGLVRLNSIVEFYGEGMARNAPLAFDTGFLTESDGDDFRLFLQRGAARPGFYSLGDGGGSNLTNWVPSVHEHISLVFFFTDAPGEGGACNPRVASSEGGCFEVSVPEPGTWLLLLTGMFGLGLVAWRRWEEEAA